MADEHPTTGTPPLTPSAFLEAMAGQFDRLHEAGQGVLLRAVPVKAQGTGRAYSGFVYAQLRDPRTSDTIDARVPETLVSELPWNQEVLLAGLVRYKAGRGGAVRPEFRIDAVVGTGAVTLPSKDDLLERWRASAARPKRDLAASLTKDRPKVTLITGVTSVAAEDVRSQLREAEGDIEFEVVRVPMTRPAEVARALLSASDSDLVVLTRGGGEGLQALEDDALIGSVASSPVPVAAALGHATDDLVLARVADASFPTPTAFGAWLRSTLDAKRARKREAAEAEALARAGEAGRLLDEARKCRSALFRWRAAALVLAVALAALAAWAFFLRQPG